MSVFPANFAELRVGEVEARSIDWTRALNDGDSIATSSWASTPAGLTLSAATLVGAVAQTRVSGGAAGTAYTLRNAVTTTGGLTMVEAVPLNVIA